MTSVFANVPNLDLAASVTFNGVDIKKVDGSLEPPQEKISISALGLKAGQAIHLAVRLRGDARFDRPNPEFATPGTQIVSGELPLDFAGSADGGFNDSREPADVYDIPVVGDATGSATGFIFGTLKRPFQASTRTSGLVTLPAYGNRFTPNDPGFASLPIDLGTGRSWYLGRPLSLAIDYGVSLPQGSRIDSSTPPVEAPPLLHWKGQSSIVPTVYYTLVTAERSDTRRLFFAGVWLGLAGACAVATLQALFERRD